MNFKDVGKGIQFYILKLFNCFKFFGIKVNKSVNILFVNGKFYLRIMNVFFSVVIKTVIIHKRNLSEAT